MNSDTKIISIIGIITVAIVIAGVMLAGSSEKSALPQITVKTDALIHPNSLRSTGSDPKIQIVEFADFECPACAMLHPSMKRIMAEYKDKIDYVFRVIPIHSHSVLAASTVFAARDQGKFIEMNDIMFENQDAWTKYGLSDADISALFAGYAQQIGLDMAKYKSDLSANAGLYKSIIDTDASDATAMGIYSTPTGIVNGKPLIRGVVTYNELKKIIENELNPKASASTTPMKASTTEAASSN